MSKKRKMVTAYLKIKVELSMPQDRDTDHELNELWYEISSNDSEVKVLDTEVKEHEILREEDASEPKVVAVSFVWNNLREILDYYGSLARVTDWFSNDNAETFEDGDVFIFFNGDEPYGGYDGQTDKFRVNEAENTFTIVSLYDVSEKRTIDPQISVVEVGPWRPPDACLIEDIPCDESPYYRSSEGKGREGADECE